MTSKIYLFALIFCFLSVSCGQKNDPPKRSSKETAIAYFEALRTKDCDTILSLAAGTLLETYQRAIKNRDADVACDAWHAPYVTVPRIDFGSEEKKDDLVVAWFRLYRTKTFFEHVSVKLKQVDGTWKVVGL